MPIHLGATDYPKVLAMMLKSKVGAAFRRNMPLNQRTAIRNAGFGDFKGTFLKGRSTALRVGSDASRRGARIKPIEIQNGEVFQYPFNEFPGISVIDYGEWWQHFRPDTRFYNDMVKFAKSPGIEVELIFHNRDRKRLKRVDVTNGDEVHTLWTDN